MRRIRVCAVDELPAGQVIKVCPPDRAPIAVFNVSGRYHAVDDTCTHGKASLSAEGRVEGDVIECGWHRGRFSLVTGKAVRFPAAVPLGAYAVSTNDGAIFIEIADGVTSE